MRAVTRHKQRLYKRVKVMLQYHFDVLDALRRFSYYEVIPFEKYIKHNINNMKNFPLIGAMGFMEISKEMRNYELLIKEEHKQRWKNKI